MSTRSTILCASGHWHAQIGTIIATHYALYMSGVNTYTVHYTCYYIVEN
jgi:hypothetical protein